jgi:hypothetical protein
MGTGIKKNKSALKLFNTSWVPVAHACNSSYSEGRDQEDHSSKPALDK